MDERTTQLEERIAHLERLNEELSEVVARHDKTLDTLLRRIRLLAQREAEREAELGGTLPLADQKPPHW